MKWVQALFLVWWLLSLGAVFIAFLCAKGFWRDYRRKKIEGGDFNFPFWTAFMFACNVAEAVVTVGASPFTTSPNSSLEGLAVAILRRTLLTAGMWLWYLKVVK